VNRAEELADGAMFHVEQNRLLSWAGRSGVELGKGAPALMVRYAAMVLEANTRQNLTGCSTLTEAVETLVVESLEPLARLNVPRGTRYADIGSGPGVPGIPLALARPDAFGVLIEAQAKRAEFMESAIRGLSIANLTVECKRVEEMARVERWRGSLDMVFSRAFGPVYVVLEMALPLLKIGGRLYIYSRRGGEELVDALADQASSLGGRIVPGGPGVVVEKLGATPNSRPRRYPAIKREAERLGCEWKNET
jgi:16S rRNA (guanine527-N7)-methyltransferase